jgi:hypothetical protein
MIVIPASKKNVPQQIKDWYVCYNVRDALFELIAFEMGARSFVWSAERFTVERALSTLPDYLLDLRCSDLGVIRFIGGPTGMTQGYDGTLLTLLCDAALRSMYTASRK